jgi:acyl carrier protein
MLINAYGLTETSDDIFHYVIPQRSDFTQIPIGLPIENVSYTLTDEHELVVWGVCVPIKSLSSDKLSTVLNGHRVIMTGDVFEVSNNSELIYIGRKNNQLKIRGYRLNPSEIELAIRNIVGITDCIIYKSADDHIVAIYAADNPVHGTVFSESLESILPAYVIPQKYIWTNKMPILPNGKKIQISSSIATQIDSVEMRFIDCLREVTSEYSVDIYSEISLDSINFVTFIVSIEDEFNFVWEDEMLIFERFRYYKDMLDYVYSRLLSSIDNAMNGK